MTQNVQTEGTNLAMVREAVLGAATPPAVGWRNIEPNSYGNFGSSFKKMPRDPITKAGQLQKGMLVDEDSGLPFDTDATKDIIDRFGEGIYKSSAKHCGNKQKSHWPVSAVTATGFTVDSLGDLSARYLVRARGLRLDANNGLFLVGAGSTNTEVKAAALAVEASPPGNADLELAGYRGATGDIRLDTDGNLTSAGAINFTTWNLQDNQFIWIGGEADANKFDTAEYYGPASVVSVSASKIILKRRNWVVEAHAKLDLSSVATQLNSVVQAKLSGPGGNSLTVASVADGTPAAKASLAMNAGGNSAHIDTVVQAKLGGTAGNAITVEVTTGAGSAAGVLTEVGTHVKIAIKITATASTVADVEALIATSTLIEVKTPGTGATSLDGTDAFDSVPLTGGTAATAPSLAEVGNATTLHYTSGATTTAQMEAVITANSTLIEVKTPGTGANILLVGDDDFGATALAGGSDGIDAGTGKNIDVYFTRYYRSVASDHDDYLLPSYAFEMTYPTLNDGSPEYEYMLGNMLDQWTWNIPLTTKANVNATFIGTRTPNPTTSRKAGPSAALSPNTKGGISTSTDIARLRIEDVDDVGISVDFVSLKIDIKNNVSAQKALGHLGAVFMNNGKHTVMVEAEMIFVSSEAIKAVRDNRECHLDVMLRNPDFGAMLDVQSMTLDVSDRKLEKDKSVLLTTKATGFENELSGTTDSLSVFAFLPPPIDIDA